MNRSERNKVFIYLFLGIAHKTTFRYLVSTSNILGFGEACNNLPLPVTDTKCLWSFIPLNKTSFCQIIAWALAQFGTIASQFGCPVFTFLSMAESQGKCHLPTEELEPSIPHIPPACGFYYPNPSHLSK